MAEVLAASMASMGLGGKKAKAEAGAASILTPGRKRLSSIEAERVIAVIDLTIRKLEVVVALSAANAER